MPETAAMNARAPSRADLSAALAAVRKARSQLEELESGQERAREKSWAAAGDVETCQERLAKLQQDEQRRLASAYAQGESVDASPVPAADYALAEARKELKHIYKVESALAAEIPSAQSRLRDTQRNFQAELSQYVVNAPQYDSLCQAHKAAWTRLRSVRAALAAIHTALGGATPIALLESAQRSESLSTNVGASIDHEFVDSWAKAMERLSSDPENAKLPSL